ncbi:MAG: AAA family ATPase, partial [Chloroflexi bacterium]|nr:AAA family ATPase [Chloroflexota bacterium]
EGNIVIEKSAAAPRSTKMEAREVGKTRRGRQPVNPPTQPLSQPQPDSDSEAQNQLSSVAMSALRTVRVFAYGVARNRLMQAAKRLGVPAAVVTEVDEADALVTLRTYYRNREQTVMEAEHRGLPIYVLRANTVAQVEQFLGDLFNLTELQRPHDKMEDIREQTQRAIAAVLNGERWVDLPPGTALVRRLQHEMARNAELVSHSYGKEPRRHVRIFRE